MGCVPGVRAASGRRRAAPHRGGPVPRRAGRRARRAPLQEGAADTAGTDTLNTIFQLGL